MKVTTTTQVTLVLTAEEAKWLNGLMQNPFSVAYIPDYEDLYDKKMREAFYKATTTEG